MKMSAKPKSGFLYLNSGKRNGCQKASRKSTRTTLVGIFYGLVHVKANRNYFFNGYNNDSEDEWPWPIFQGHRNKKQKFHLSIRQLDQFYTHRLKGRPVVEVCRWCSKIDDLDLLLSPQNPQNSILFAKAGSGPVFSYKLQYIVDFGLVDQSKAYDIGPIVYNTNTIQYNTIQYNTIQYNTIQYNTIQYNTITIQYNTIQYNTIQYNTIQYNTIQYNTIQYNNTIHYNTIQYNTI